MDLMLQHEAIVLLFTFYYRYNVDVDFHLYCTVSFFRPVEFYVYNADSDEVRVAIIMPSDQWGGEGILGARLTHQLIDGA
jgi:hypothetical protein